MDPQLQAILNFLASGNPAQNSSMAGYGLQSGAPQNSNVGADSTQLPNISSFSPVSANPNYANTIQRFFNYNPVAGPKPFTSTPLKSGASGQNTTPGSSGWSSFLPNDPSSIMRTLSGEQ